MRPFLIVVDSEVKQSELMLAIQATFEKTGTHKIPDKLSFPPKGWTQSYKRMIESLDFDKTSLAEAYAMLQQFLDPVLKDKTKETRWNPSEWRWE